MSILRDEHHENIEHLLEYLNMMADPQSNIKYYQVHQEWFGRSTYQDFLNDIKLGTSNRIENKRIEGKCQFSCVLGS